jgi:hypothetical protein
MQIEANFWPLMVAAAVVLGLVAVVTLVSLLAGLAAVVVLWAGLLIYHAATAGKDECAFLTVKSKRRPHL